MTAKFISYEFESAININVVDVTFPKLNKTQKDIISQYLCGLIQMIATCYDFYSNRINFETKLKQNNYKDLRWIITYLIPYVNQTKKTLKDLTDLNELYTLRYDSDMIPFKTKEQALQLKIEDINLVAPKYLFSNIQYGRCIRGSYENGGNRSIKFDESHIRDNYYLLLDTIRSSRYKLYINWIDILPFRIDNFKTSKLYLDTKDKINNNNYNIFDVIRDYPVNKYKDDKQIELLNSALSGLNIEDIYNTISLDLYDSIVTYKWLIFDIVIKINGVETVVPLIQILNILMEFQYIIDSDEWDTLGDNTQKNFSILWDRLITSYEKSIQLVNNIITIPYQSIRTILKSFVVFFNMKYSKINSLKKDTEKSYIPLTRTHKIIDDYDERMKDISDSTALISLKSIKNIYAYDFLKEVIQGFKLTWYSRYLMNSDKTQINPILDINGYQIVSDGPITIQITYKNVYNFCKSMVHIQKNTKTDFYADTWDSDNYIRLPSTWSELSDKQQAIIIDRINNKTSEWFNITRNLWQTIKTIKPSADRMSVDPYIKSSMKKIYDTIRKNLVDILFETMISKGTMSYMVADTDLTNNALFDISNNIQKKNLIKSIVNKRFADNKYAENSYYYLTNKPFGELGPFYIKLDDDIEPKEYTYFDFCSKPKTAWYVATAYHWIAQIGFCHRFINNRVTYITAGTGAGKSTQVPKLYLYFLKAIDRIESPMVVITVPRTNVATGVSLFVSTELAVPYREYDRETKKESKINNNNYYIQYQHMNEQHTDNGLYPKIRFITDGTVLIDASDPLIKNKRLITDSDKSNMIVYNRSNKYDIVIIDEAHEHNANMDMILSLMKNAIRNNNKMRLVIMSATMDADEPIYRRFYRDINDNRKFPLNQWIKKHNIDRINTERRFHISPPDESTRFKITEFYRPGENAENIIKEIIKSSTDGDILLFQPGVAEISKSLELLNSDNFLPADVIALPYHAKLPAFYKSIIENIDKYLKLFKLNKNTDVSMINSDTGLYTGSESYKRCIIIATNVAEASITINSLRYVVDTGIEKSMNFDFERRSNILKPNYITEASRLQRKGRVGRVAPGTAYYTYKKGELENNKKQFNIATQDNSQLLLNNIRDLNDIPILSDLANTLISGINVSSVIDKFAKTHNITDLIMNNNVIVINEKNMSKLIRLDYIDLFNKYNINTSSKAVDEYIESIINILSDHYFGAKEYYDYIGNPQMYDYQNTPITYPVYSSGFDVKELTDSLGEFYIIHPDEIVISRNIAGEIVTVDNYGVIRKNPQNSSNYRISMLSNKIIVFWESLINMGFIGISPTQQLYRTQLGTYLQYCNKNIILEDNMYIKLLFFGYGLTANDDEFEQILNIVAMMGVFSRNPLTKNIIDTSILIQLADNPKMRKNTERQLRDMVKSNFNDNNKLLKSDISLLLNICKFVDKTLKDHKIEYNLFNTSSFKNNKYVDETGTYDISGIISGLLPNTTRSKDDLKKRKQIIDRIHNSHIIDMKDIMVKYARQFTNLGLDLNSLMNFLKHREVLRKSWNDIIYDINNTGDTKEIDMVQLRKLLKPYRLYMDNIGIDIVKGTLLLSNPYNIYAKILHSNSSYVSLYNPNIDMIMSIAPNDTFVDQTFLQGYVLNLSENLEKKTISMLISIDAKDLKLIANIYNKKEMQRKLSSNMITSQKLHNHIDAYLHKLYDIDSTENKIQDKPQDKPQDKYQNINNIDYRDYNVPEHLTAITNLTKTIEKLKPDIQTIQTSSNVWNILMSIGVGYSDYSKLLRS
jgi:HrpA-like RNA helicase